MREQHDGLPTDFRPNPLAVPAIKGKRRTFSEGLEQVIPDEVSAAVMEAIGRHLLFLEEKSKKSKAKYLQSHQLYLAILVLLFFSGRRSWTRQIGAVEQLSQSPPEVDRRRDC